MYKQFIFKKLSEIVTEICDFAERLDGGRTEAFASDYITRERQHQQQKTKIGESSQRKYSETETNIVDEYEKIIRIFHGTSPKVSNNNVTLMLADFPISHNTPWLTRVNCIIYGYCPRVA